MALRAVIYARYSSESQNESSIADQIRLCKERIAAQDWTLTDVYRDAAISGATTIRPGYQALIEDARNASFDVIVAEALDRLSRDQEDVAGLFKRMQFAGVRIITVAEGEISELHVGLKGTMNALYLKDLAQKSHRGLEGRVRAGRSGGGISYGYAAVPGPPGPDGLPERGLRRILGAEAATVVRIFQDYAAGRSAKAIAQALNRNGIAGPRGGAWGPSTITGNAARGNGQRALRRPAGLEPAALPQGPGDRAARLAVQGLAGVGGGRGARAADRRGRAVAGGQGTP